MPKLYFLFEGVKIAKKCQSSQESPHFYVFFSNFMNKKVIPGVGWDIGDDKR